MSSMDLKLKISYQKLYELRKKKCRQIYSRLNESNSRLLGLFTFIKENEE